MKSIYIISEHPIFGAGIQEMVQCMEGVGILGFECDLSRALDQIQARKPDIVVFDFTEERIEGDPSIIHHLLKGVKTKVIGVNFLSNTFVVYTRQEHEVKKMEDLLNEIDKEESIG